MLFLMYLSVFLIAGVFVSFWIFNRYVLKLSESLFKSFLTYATFLILISAFGLSGYFSYPGWFLIIPILIISFYFYNAFYRHRFRKKHQFYKPLSIEYPPSSQLIFTTTNLQITRYRCILSKSTHDSIRIAHLSDMHLDLIPDSSFYEKVINAVNASNPHIAVLTGDFISRNEFLPQLYQCLKELNPRMGSYAVLGNHDIWEGAEETRRHLEMCGIKVVSAKCSLLKTKSGATVKICGDESPWGEELKCQETQYMPADLSIILTHTPDNMFKLSRKDADIVFSGHLHGGQWIFPLVGPPVSPSRYGRLFQQGHYLVNGTHHFISAGLGIVWYPLRIFCNPEITIIDVDL